MHAGDHQHDPACGRRTTCISTSRLGLWICIPATLCMCEPLVRMQGLLCYSPNPTPTSSSQGAPKEVPLSICVCSAALTSSLAAPTIAGPQLPM